MKAIITGLGSIGRRHARLMLEEGFVEELLAFRTGKGSGEPPEWLDRDSVRVIYDLEAALAEDPDVAFVTNPTHLHVPTALDCARAGCDLFIEKPLSHSMEGVDELISVVQTQEVISLLGTNLRFHPVLQRLDSLLSNEVLGEIYSFEVFCGSYLPDWRPDRDYRESYSAKREEGGGVLLDLIHEIDYACWLFGDPVEQYAWSGQISDLDIDSEDLAEIIFRTGNGVVGTIHLDYFRREPRRDVEVSGRSGYLRGDLLENTLELVGEEEETWTFTVERDDLYRNQLEYFFECVRTRTPTFNDLSEAATVLELALDLRNS